jgi:hypothetical protein
MKSERLWILLGGVLLISAAFLLLNFRVAISNTEASKLIVTMGDNTRNPMQLNEKMSILLVGEGPLVRALQKALTEKMDEVGMGEIELVQELEPGYQDPVLVVKVGNPGSIWTPFFAMSEFPIHAGYASNGDTTFMKPIEETHTSIASSNPSIFNMYAEYKVNDRSLGLISRLGYQQYLADYLAQEIVAALKNPHNG